MNDLVDSYGSDPCVPVYKEKVSSTSAVMTCWWLKGSNIYAPMDSSTTVNHDHL